MQIKRKVEGGELKPDKNGKTRPISDQNDQNICPGSAQNCSKTVPSGSGKGFIPIS